MPSQSALRARALRRAMSLPERRLWALLRRRQTGVKFRRQEPFGAHIVGFLSHEARLVIEIADRHDHPDSAAIRAEDVALRGFRLLCFSGEEVLADPDRVLYRILRALPPPS